MNIQKTHLIIGVTAIALVGAGLGALLFGGHPSHEGETPEQHAAELGFTVTDERAEEGEHGPEEVVIDDAGIASAGIGLIDLAPGALGSEIVAQATVKAAPDGEAILTARASGAITDIRKRLGDPVKKGETVAVVLSPDAAGLSAARASARARLDLAQTTFAREKTLFDSRITSRQEFEAAQAELNQASAEFQRADAAARTARVAADGQSVVIASQIDGRITMASDAARLGAYVTPETVLFRIADPSKVQVEAAVSAADIARIRPGDPAAIEGPGGASLPATVRAVTPGVDQASRTATVVLSLSGGGGLQPGQYARALIKPASAASETAAFVLPEEAVQQVEGRDVVFVRTREGFVTAPVRLGVRSGGRVEIVAGLEPGQVVAGRKAFVLKAELGKGEAGHDH